MDWVFIGTLVGSLVTSTHSGRETCEGRAVMLREKGVIGRCVFVKGDSVGVYSFYKVAPLPRIEESLPW
jgi:hypothetical protein